MAKIIGIDLGTTNSCVAVVEGGKPVVIPNAEGQRTTPSVVAFTKLGERLVGEPAKRQAVTNAPRTVSSVKRLMGSETRVPIDGKCYTPQELSALILQKLKADAEAYLGEPVTEAVITVPAYFNDAQRQATKDAGRIAGLDVRRIINEPTAAALAYGLDNGRTQTVMVYDLGGGTFDVSLIRIGDGIVQVLSTCGDNFLGGDDFDERIVNWLADRCRAEHGVDLTNDRVAMQRLREEAEKAKKELSSAKQTDINLPFLTMAADGALHLQTTLTRAKFEELCADLIERTALPVRNALSDARLSASDLDQVLLVGGSTRIPAVQAKVVRMTGLEPSKSLNPDECVALGAAVQAGRLGGEVVYQGDMKDLQKDSNSYTVRYLLGEETIPVPESRRPWNQYIEITGARENNLKGVDVRFPLNVMTVVTGVSGSGKSTLVRDIFFRALKRELDECTDRPGEFASISGDLRNLRNVEFVDQNPIGKSSRSNPVTYIKAYDEIRKLWAEQPLAKQMGYTTGHFSFNSEGGRCEECKGEGTITVEMQFMADLVLECESCHGKRFKADTLEVKFHDVNIYDVLEMTVNQAIEFFTAHGQKKIVKRLQPLQDVGLGYIKLGQSSSTLSGGENQRVKLAYYLSMEKAAPTLFIFDEPTTGLHFHDIRKLLEAFDALIRRGHSIVIIEHNMDVVKCADHVIDLGPEGGDKGGYIVATGTPEEVAACAASYTGQFLKEKLTAAK